MEKKEGFKQTKLGWIPEDWEVRKLGDISSFRRGSFPQPYGLNKWYDNKNGFPFVQVFDVGDNFELKGCTKLKITDIAVKKSVLVKKGTLILTIQGSIGRIAEMQYDACVDRTLLIFQKISPCISKKYFMYSISKIFEKEKKLAWGGTIKVITKEKLKNFSIPLPPLPEQQKIAQVLSTWDEAISTTENLIQQLKRRKKGLMQQLLTGKTRVRGFGGQFSLTKLKGLLGEVKKRNKGLAVTQILSVTNLKGFIKQSEQFSKQVASKDLSKYKVVRKGQFAYNPSRVNVGSIDLLKNFKEGVLSPMYIVFEAHKERLNSDFLYYSLTSYRFIGRIPQFVQGSVRDSLSFKGLEAMDFFVPTLPEQEQIASILAKADEAIEVHDRHLALLRQQKKGLMQQLLTGKKRIKP